MLKKECVPAFCAHRGVSALMPENSLPGFGAALALGADEIEFDVWLTKDQKLVVSHDRTLERISDGNGSVGDHTLAELKRFNVGYFQNWQVPFCTAEEVFAQFANRITMNIHLKETGPDGALVKQLAALTEQYRASECVYLSGSEAEIPDIAKYAPKLQRNVIQFPETADLYSLAVGYGCTRVQFWLGMFDVRLIKRLHEAGVCCNLFYADTAADMAKYTEMGVDVILTNRMDIAAQWRQGLA